MRKKVNIKELSYIFIYALATLKNKQVGTPEIIEVTLTEFNSLAPMLRRTDASANNEIPDQITPLGAV